MKLLVLPHLLHGGEVHSVDIDLSNSYVATAGNDAEICVWDFKLLSNIEAASEEELLKIKPVHVLKPHSHPVKVARWSLKSPLFLASGDVSGNVFLTNMTDMSHKLLYPWPLIQDKNNEIADIAWSADSRLLAWSTSDGKVHLYDVLKETYQVLNQAQGDNTKMKNTAQKSLAFNHSNNNLVTMGVDTFLHLYQYQYDSCDNYQFKLTNKISKLMNNNPTTMVTINYERISWSSDDEFFSVPSASKQHTSLISLLARSQDWENKISLVGHDVNCDVVRFNPYIFQGDTESNDSHSYNVYHIIASAGSDKTLALWNTSKETPILVLRELSKKPIVDICWDNSGTKLLLASLDGHISVVSFDQLELGTHVPDDLLQKLKDSQKANIKPFVVKESESSSKRGQKATVELIEQKDSIKLSDAFAESADKNDLKDTAAMENARGDSIEDSTNGIEVHGDIHPQVLESNAPGQIDDIMSTAMGERTRVTSSTKTKGASSRSTPKPAPASSTGDQKVTTKNGKKRIQPMLISNGNGPVSRSTTLAKGSDADSLSKSSSKPLMEFDKPSYAVSEEVRKESKRDKAQEDGGPVKKIRRELEPVKFIGTAVLNPNTAFAKVRLLVPKVRLAFQIPSRTDDRILLDIKNGQGNENTPSRLTCFKNEQPIWSDFIPRFIQLATEGTSFWAVCTADGQLITYHHISGKRFLPPIVLGSPIVFLESYGDYLMAVTAIGELFVWDMQQRKLHLHCPLSLASILDLHTKFREDTLSKSENITMCSITSKGIPLVTLSNGSGYLFNADMGVWQTVTEAWWAFGSHYWDSISDDKVSMESHNLTSQEPNHESSILGLLEHKTNEEILRKSRVGRGKFFNKISKNLIMKEGFENLENSISLTHLENRILCCELLGEFRDFHDFLITYSKRICELGLKAKLFELCERILGPNSDSDKSTSNSQLCGYNREELLKEIILACAQYRDAQRILNYFGKKLGLINDEY